MVKPLAGPPEGLCEPGGIRVVIYVDVYLETLFQHVPERQVLPPLQVGRIVEDAPYYIHRARGTGPDPGDPGAFRACVLKESLDHAEHLSTRMGKAPGLLGRELLPGHPFAGAREQPPGDLGAADVQAQNQWFHGLHCIRISVARETPLPQRNFPPGKRQYQNSVVFIRYFSRPGPFSRVRSRDRRFSRRFASFWGADCESGRHK